MSGIEDIDIKIGPVATADGGHRNALPILHQVRHALRNLVEAGESSVIDLRAIPFGPDDETALWQALGDGEVRATVDALGCTRVCETGYPGVWLVDYYNTEDERIAFQVEVTELPSMLRSHREDIQDSLRRLEEALLA